jgi:predicted RNase H-like HicB family nuclease
MIELPYSLVIEATADPEYFSFYSPDLEGFTGAAHSVEECLQKATKGMQEFVDALKDRSLPIPERNAHPRIVIQNDPKVEVA